MTAEKLRSRSCKDLATLAREQGISGWHAMRKDQLIQALVRLARKKAAVAHNGRSARHPANGKTHAHGKVQARAKGLSDVPASKSVGLSQGSSRRDGTTTVVTKPFRQWQKDLAGVGRQGARPASKDRLVVMVRDAFWLHACWELRRQSVERAEAALGQQWHGAKPVLRIWEVISDGTTNTVEKVLRDVEIHGGVNNWYLHVDHPPATFRVAIGYRAADQFYCIARSNVVTTPSPDSSDELDHNWDEVARNFDKIYALSGGYDQETPSGELQELFEERLRRPMGSPMARFGVGAEGAVHSGRGFRFDVETEMIVYGAVSPGSRVTLRGEPVQLRKDGSFTIRVSLPDRRQVIPVVANSIDGVEQRTIVLAVERNKKVMETLIREPEEPMS